jgi:hypothetical protein
MSKTIYVSQAGSGTGDGSSSSNRASLSWLNDSANWGSDASDVNAGDTVSLSGTFTSRLVVAGSGSAGSPVLIILEPGAKFSKAYWGTDAAIYASGKSYITIDGYGVGVVENTANGTALANQQLTCGVYAENGTSITIKRLVIQNMYVRTAYSDDSTGAAGVGIRGVSTSAVSNLLIDENAISDCKYGIFADPAGASSNVTVSGNSVSRCSTFVAIANSVQATVTGVAVRDNTFEDGYFWDFTNGDVFHGDGLHMWSASGGSFADIEIVRNNMLTNYGAHTTGCIFIEGAVGTYNIFSNLLGTSGVKIAEAVLDITGTSSTTGNIYNNTVVGAAANNTGGIGFYVQGVSWTSLKCKNNIFYNLYTGVLFNDGQATAALDFNYNDYYQCQYVGLRVNVPGSGDQNGSYANLSAFAAALGNKGDEANGSVDNPNLSAAYRLVSPSAAIGTAFNLSSVFTYDATNSTRTIPWDIGAYSYVRFNWYIDGTLVSGGNNGTSWANAWRSFGDIVWGVSGVKAGDTLYISGGAVSKTYSGEFTIGASGTSGNRITISVGQDTGHNGLVIWDFDSLGDESASATTVAIRISQQYITLTGNYGGACHFVIKNLRYIHDGIWTAAISGTSPLGSIIEYVSVDNCNNAVWLDTSPTWVEIRYCSLTKIRGDGAVKLVGSTGVLGASSVHHNTIECLWNNAQPPGDEWAFGGPDGIQCGSGVDIYNNVFIASTTAVYTSGQHPDSIQGAGNYLRIFNNEFRNVADSNLDFDRFSTGTPNNILIYNNVFWTQTVIDAYPDLIRMYATGGTPLTSITNLKIFNNIFSSNNTWYAISIDGFNGGNPTASGCEIKNNVFFNCGNGAGLPILKIGTSSGWVSADWDTDANVWYSTTGTQYVNVEGVSSTVADWVAANEPNGSVLEPTFVGSAGGDFRPFSSSVQTGAGIDLSAYFTTDYSGNTRAVPWDIGAYRYDPFALSAIPISTSVIRLDWSNLI